MYQHHNMNTNRVKEGSQTNQDAHCENGGQQEELIPFVISSLLESEPEHIDKTMVTVLNAMACRTGAERCFFALLDENKRVGWMSEGVAPGVELLNIPHSQFALYDYPWLEHLAEKGESVVFSDIRSFLPQNAHEERGLFENAGYLAACLIPIKVKGRPIGLLGFGHSKKPFNWPKPKRDCFHTIGLYLCATIGQRREHKRFKTQQIILEDTEEMAGMGSWEYTFATRGLKASPQFFQLMGLSQSNTLKLSLFTVARKIEKKEFKALHESIKQLLENGEMKEGEIRLRTDRGEWMYCRFMIKVRLSNSGKPINLRGFIQDISKQKSTEARKLAAQRKLRLIYRNIRDFVVLFRVEAPGVFHIETWNDAFFNFHRNLSPNDLTPKAFKGLELTSYFDNYLKMPKEIQKKRYANFQEALTTQHPVMYSEYSILENGKEYFLESSLTPIIEGGKCTYLLWTSHDVTQLKTIERELREKDKYFQLAKKASKLGFFKRPIDGDEIYIDGTYSEMLGFDDAPRTLNTKYFHKNIEPDSLKKLRDQFISTWNSDQKQNTIENEYSIKTPKGIRHIATAGLASRENDNDPGMYIGFARDITNEKNAAQKLLESEARWRALHEGASDAIVILEKDVFMDCNLAALEVFGCSSKEDLLGKTPWDFSPKKQPDGKLSIEKGQALLKTADKGDIIRFPWVHQRTNGDSFPCEVSLSSVHINEHNLVQAILRDVSERVRIITALRQSEEKYKALIEASLQGILIVYNNNPQYFNSALAQMLGFQGDELYGLTVNQLFDKVHMQDLPLFTALNQEAAQHPVTGEFRFRHVTGEYIWLRCRISQIAYAERNATLLTAVDITDIKRAREYVVASATDSEDRERMRIATELHDGLGQLLTTASLNLGAIKISPNCFSERDATKLDTAIASIKAAMEETRSIALNLMPKAVQDFGYALAAEQLIASLNQAGTVRLIFYTNVRDQRFSPKLERNLYRITQEALMNILKHSEAETGVVQLIRYPEMIVLSIEDDGIGFDTAISDHLPRNLGLRNIITRSEAIGARLDLSSQPGNGTIITLEIPLPNAKS